MDETVNVLIEELSGNWADVLEAILDAIDELNVRLLESSLEVIDSEELSIVVNGDGNVETEVILKSNDTVGCLSKFRVVVTGVIIGMVGCMLAVVIKLVVAWIDDIVGISGKSSS